MKYIWSADDIKPGRVVCKPPSYHKITFFDPEKAANWVYLIGYHGGSDNVMLISVVDGMVTIGETPDKLARRLNEDSLIPMPHAWLMKTMTYLRDNRERD